MPSILRSHAKKPIPSKHLSQFTRGRIFGLHEPHQQKNLFHRTYRARVRTKPVRSLPPVLPDLLSRLCLSSLASGAPGRPTFPPKRPTPSLRPHPLPASSCCIRPLIFSSTGLLPTLTNCAHLAALPDSLSPLAT